MAVAHSLKNFVATYLMSRELSLVVLVAAFAGAAKEAHALDFGCRDKEQVSRELEAENQAPIVKFFIDGRKRGAETPDWTEVYYTTDIKTGNGYRLLHSDNNKMCVMATTTNTRLFNNATLDEKAYLDAPDADKKGTGINNLIYGTSINDGENPMLRVVEHDPYWKRVDVMLLLIHPKTGEGGLVASTLDGQYISKFSKGIPAKGLDGAPHGAQYTNTGKLLLGMDDADQQAEKPAAQ
ncbi:MAG TPA: hypothetical protein PL131_11185 [Methylotenera sp.]|nr:hypothetical protein [Methylotenera sp.]HPH06430.1 hypothetical protein [Methylotenera sp.]HPN00423.1 hypothetical protein [Methylotenera sp.]